MGVIEQSSCIMHSYGSYSLVCLICLNGSELISKASSLMSAWTRFSCSARRWLYFHAVHQYKARIGAKGPTPQARTKVPRRPKSERIPREQVGRLVGSRAVPISKVNFRGFREWQMETANDSIDHMGATADEMKLALRGSVIKCGA